MTTRLRKQQEDTNYRILRLLEENPNLSQRELAKSLGLSLGGLNYCLQALLEKGVVKMHNFQNSQRKAAYAYLLTPSGIAEKAALTGRFLKRKMEEYEALKAEIESLQTEALRMAVGKATVSGLSASRPALTQNAIRTDAQLLSVLAQFPYVVQAIVFGSVAQGTAHPESDLDMAVAAKQALTQAQKMEIVAALAQATGRPVDLIDLNGVTEPLLGQILRHGRRLLGGDAAYAGLISRHVFAQADFVPYRNRVLAERRAAWIG